MELLTIGTLLDMFSELQADDLPPVYTASQQDMDRFKNRLTMSTIMIIICSGQSQLYFGD